MGDVSRFASSRSDLPAVHGQPQVDLTDVSAVLSVLDDEERPTP